MPRRVPIRLVRLLAIACACLVPAAAAQAQPPPNDVKSAAQVVAPPGWTSLSAPQNIVVQASDWTDATTGPEDADPLPSCTGTVGFRSIWYQMAVPEAAVLRVTVLSTQPSRYQPVVSVLNPLNQEVGCGLANDLTVGATANATAYVTPNSDGTPAIYLIRVAEVTNNSQSGGLPMLTVSFAGQDVTPPHIRVQGDSGKVPPGQQTGYDANGTSDLASGVDQTTAQWEFHDKRADGTPSIRTRDGLNVKYTWLSPGPHEVEFRVSDRAGNQAMYSFTTFVQDTIRPDVRFSLRPPEPGARRMHIVVKASESVKVRLLVTQVGRKGPLVRRFVSFWGTGAHARSVALRVSVGKGLLVISGIARDLAGNATALPQCTVDPVTGQGACTAP
jgi:hypothetical protein